MIPSILFKPFLAGHTAFFASLIIVVLRVSGSRRKGHRLSRIWARGILLAAGVKLRVEGLEKLEGKPPVLFLSNHASQFDIFALLAAVPFHFGFLAKEELFEIPLLGNAMLGVGHLPIERGDMRKAFKSISQVTRTVREGLSFVVFPEGTRSRTGELLPFKPGAFHIALGTGRPVVPVVIKGSFEVQPREGVPPKPGVISVKFLDPIDVSAFGRGDKTRLMEMVRGLIVEELETDAPGPGPSPS